MTDFCIQDPDAISDQSPDILWECPRMDQHKMRPLEGSILTFGHRVSWAGGLVQFSYLHRSGTRFPGNFVAFLEPKNVPAPLSGGVSDLWVELFVVGEKTTVLFLNCIKKPLGNARLVSVIY